MSEPPVVSADGRIRIPTDREMTPEEKLAVCQRFVEDWTLSTDRNLRWSICRALGWRMPDEAER